MLCNSGFNVTPRIPRSVIIFCTGLYIEDLIRVVISYEMNTSVRFSLSYESLKMGFKNIAFRSNIISIRKRIVDTGVVNDVTCSRQSVIITRVVIRFYDMTLSTE